MANAIDRNPSNPAPGQPSKVDSILSLLRAILSGTFEGRMKTIRKKIKRISVVRALRHRKSALAVSLQIGPKKWASKTFHGARKS